MENILKEQYHRLLDETQEERKRFLFEKLNLKHRLIGLIGARGVGKTTLLLQYIKQHALQNQAIYFSADLFYFNSHSLYETVDQLVKLSGYKYFFIDEIHKYANWSQELKNLYDTFPSIKIVFSGSSSLDIIKGSHDLSRRAHMLHLPGLSFREYLNFTLNKEQSAVNFNEIINADFSFTENTLLQHFLNYLQFGYYPFFIEDQETLYSRIMRTVEKSIYEDIANYYSLKTQHLPLFKKILNFLATTPPGETNIHKIAQSLQIDHKTTSHYLNILENSDLIHQLESDGTGHQQLRKQPKILLNNTSLLYAFNQQLNQTTDIGNARELFFIQHLKNAGLPIFKSKIGDFESQGQLFEIGGKNKTRDQLKNNKGITAKDGILVATKGTIPLWQFGFLY